MSAVVSFSMHLVKQRLCYGWLLRIVQGRFYFCHGLPYTSIYLPTKGKGEHIGFNADPGGVMSITSQG